MGKENAREFRAKVFKSGNSLALRLPKELGLKEGSTMVLARGASRLSRRSREEAPKRQVQHRQGLGLRDAVRPAIHQGRGPRIRGTPRLWDDPGMASQAHASTNEIHVRQQCRSSP